MNGQAIPGFYWDAEKKKYFKIQTAAAAREQNLKYSAENIKKNERKERDQKIATVQSQRKQRERVTRKHGSLTQICQDRELGTRRRSYYLQSLWPDACAYGVLTRPKRVVEKPSGPIIRLFDRDPVTKTVYVVHGDNSIKRRRMNPKEEGPPLPNLDLDGDEVLQPTPLTQYSFEPWDELQRTTSTVSSLNYLPTTGALAVTTYGSDRPPVVYLSDPDRDGPYVGEQFTPRGCSTIWGAAARPNSFMAQLEPTNSVPASHAEHLAVAASNSMLLFSRSLSGAWTSSTPTKYLGTDVLCLDWISHTTIAFGCRDGKIRLYDSRSDGSSHILTHPNPVSHIKRADDPTRLVVSGLQNGLYLYDIRSPRVNSRTSYIKSPHNGHSYNAASFKTSSPNSWNLKKRQKLSHSDFNNCSQPVLTFPYSNADDLELGIDVHSRLGLVAAAQDQDSSTAIRVSNLWTGETVKEIPVRESKAASSARNRIRCVKFTNDGEDGDVSLWAIGGGSIARYAW
ncbi:hypothetical protein EK21DRAFT_79675 [Setomelanomma holmii]|uniref:WD40 repeat-like protein n=1 Tax=Setomelanomma holmii TaxID=210430 RepID=A0A9P4GW35_9PLEO|nr:hypothetical protein EK21DRAFT_79675 [Setomelanomma holmii]